MHWITCKLGQKKSGNWLIKLERIWKKRSSPNFGNEIRKANKNLESSSGKLTNFFLDSSENPRLSWKLGKFCRKTWKVLPENLETKSGSRSLFYFSNYAICLPHNNKFKDEDKQGDCSVTLQVIDKLLAGLAVGWSEKVMYCITNGIGPDIHQPCAKTTIYSYNGTISSHLY